MYRYQSSRFQSPDCAQPESCPHDALLDLWTAGLWCWGVLPGGRGVTAVMGGYDSYLHTNYLFVALH